MDKRYTKKPLYEIEYFFNPALSQIYSFVENDEKENIFFYNYLNYLINTFLYL